MLAVLLAWTVERKAVGEKVREERRYGAARAGEASSAIPFLRRRLQLPGAGRGGFREEGKGGQACSTHCEKGLGGTGTKLREVPKHGAIYAEGILLILQRFLSRHTLIVIQSLILQHGIPVLFP